MMWLQPETLCPCLVGHSMQAVHAEQCYSMNDGSEQDAHDACTCAWALLWRGPSTVCRLKVHPYACTYLQLNRLLLVLTLRSRSLLPGACAACDLHHPLPPHRRRWTGAWLPGPSSCPSWCPSLCPSLCPPLRGQAPLLQSMPARSVREMQHQAEAYTAWCTCTGTTVECT